MLRVTHITKKRIVLFGLGAGSLIALGVVFAALNTISTAKAQSQVTNDSPIVTVNTETISPQDVRVWSNFSGRTHAIDYAEIRPEVSGHITAVRFRDGQTVKAGEVLFVIDPRPYEAAVAKAEANLASANANVGLAKTELDRAAIMVKTQAIPQRLYDERANTFRVSQAAVQIAEAELKQVKIDLDRAYVKAPISGRVSRAEITLGNLVQAGANAPVLTSIVSRDGIYADFDVDEQTYMEGIGAHAGSQDKELRIPVELTTQGDAVHHYKGKIYSFDNHIDTGSGTIRARAKFANENGSLIPGMFVSIKLANSSDSSSLMVPRRAIGNDQNKKFVYVVGTDNKVAYREVSLGQEIGDREIIRSGLQGGERVIVDGLELVKPGMAVLAKEIAGEGISSKKIAAN